MATALLFVVSCGGAAAGPPHGPAHDPVNSPEAKSPCPDKWAAAKQAREELMELSGPDRAAGKEAVFRAVLAQAVCEAGVFARWNVEVGPMQIMTAELRAIRQQFHNVRNLYQEVAQTAEGRYRVLGLAGVANLNMTFADKLAQLPMPSDVAPDQRQSWRLQQIELSQYFAAEGQLAAEKALTNAPTPAHTDGELVRAVADCCRILAAAADGRTFPACTAGATP